ncbi:MAG TPA: hypothetical protein PK771_16050, partial [Spirochaetota bacterium]|nr:hypothetical protein [Spirochaetota bacterium]
MKKMKIQGKILLFFVISSILPMMILILISLRLIFGSLEKNSFIYYSTLLSEVSTNIDFVYDQIENTLTNLMTLSNVKSGLSETPFKNADEELSITNMVVGYEGVKVGSMETMETGMRQTIEEKIDGYCILYQLNKKSIIDGTDYKAFKSSRYIQFPNYEVLANEPLYKQLSVNENLDMVLGKVDKKVFPTGSVREVYDIPIVLFPHKVNKNSKNKFDILLFVALSYGFIEKFYQDISDLKNGTLYILDQFGTPISFNHPNDDDFYTYDEDTKKYIIEDDEPKFDEDTGMTYGDYNLLNSDVNILNNKEVQNLLNTKSKDFKTIKYNGVKYLSVVMHSNKSKLKFIYFQPIDLIRKPIYSLVKYILIVA